MPETIEDRYAQPMEVDDLDIAFPSSVIGSLIPEHEELPEEFRKNWDHNAFCEKAEAWFVKGSDPGQFRGDIDRRKAIRHLQCVLGSFEPSHEHKIGAVGFLLSLWLK